MKGKARFGVVLKTTDQLLSNFIKDDRLTHIALYKLRINDSISRNLERYYNHYFLKQPCFNLHRLIEK